MTVRAHDRWKGWRVNEAGRPLTGTNPDRDERASRRIEGPPVEVKQMDERDRLWYWTLGRSGHRCAECCEPTEGVRVAYCHALGKAYCDLCAAAADLAPRESRTSRGTR